MLHIIIHFKTLSCVWLETLLRNEQKPFQTKLIHLTNEVIQLILPVSSIARFNVVVSLLLETTQWTAQLEWPQKVIGFLEVRTHRVDLMNKILNANDAKLAKSLQISTHHKIKLGILRCNFKRLMLSI